MKISHHNRIVELDNAWWAEAGLQNFIPKNKTYRVDKEKAEGKEILEIRIDNISPVKRELGVPKFNTCPDTGIDARTRVTNILRGFVSDDAIEPVELYSLPLIANSVTNLKMGLTGCTVRWLPASPMSQLLN